MWAEILQSSNQLDRKVMPSTTVAFVGLENAVRHCISYCDNFVGHFEIELFSKEVNEVLPHSKQMVEKCEIWTAKMKRQS